MYTNNLYEINEGTEVVIRYARGEKFAKGKVVKTTKTQLTVEYVSEEGRTFTERFSKSNGDQIGGKAYIGRVFGEWTDSGTHTPARLMTYEDADEEIKSRKARELVEAQKRETSKQAAQNKFNLIVEKTRQYRESLALIDEETQTYKIVVMSEKNNRMLGIFKVREDEYFSWDTKEYQKGMAVELSYSGHSNSWGSRTTINAKSFDEALDKVIVELYESW